MGKHAIVNVRNLDDNMCFMWAVLSAIYPANDRNGERVTKYQPYINSIDLSGIIFPTSISQIARFERNNPTISVNVYALGEDEKDIVPKRVTK